MYKSVITGLRTVVALLLLVSAQVWAADGQVRTLSGGVFVNSTVAVVGTEVNSGDMLSTGPGAWVVVVMSDGTVLNLKADSKVEVSKYVYNKSRPAANASDVRIGIGTLRYVSGLIAEIDPSDVAIRAGNTTLGLRGSESETNYDGNRATTKIISGNWTSNHPNRGSRSFGAGQTDTTDDDTGAGDISTTSSQDAPSDDQGGKETGDLGQQDADERGAPDDAGAPDDTGTQDADEDADADADADDGDQGDDNVPPPADTQPPVFSDDPASTSDPNTNG